MRRRLAKVWRVVNRRAYARDMGMQGRHRRLEPVRQPPELHEFRGKWVAVKDGRVVAAANSSLELVSEVRRQLLKGAVAQYVPEPSDTITIGVG